MLTHNGEKRSFWNYWTVWQAVLKKAFQHFKSDDATEINVCVCVCVQHVKVWGGKTSFSAFAHLLHLFPHSSVTTPHSSSHQYLYVPSFTSFLSSLRLIHMYFLSLCFSAVSWKALRLLQKKKGSVSLSAAELLYNPDLLAANRRQAWSQFGIDCSNSITCANGPCYYRCFFFLYDLFILNFRIYRNDMNPSLFASVSVDRLSDTDPRCRSGRGA